MPSRDARRRSPSRPDRRAVRHVPVGVVLRTLAWRVRRVLPLAFAGLVALGVARVLAPPPPPTAPLVVLADAVTSGSTLDRSDVRVVRVPLRVLPDDAPGDLADVVGARLVVDLPRGSPVVPGVLAAGRFGLEPPEGTVVVPLPLAGAAGLLRPGDRVDVVARTVDEAAGAPEADGAGGTSSGPGAVLARGALVLSVEGTPTGGSLLGAAPDDGVVLTVVAVRPAEGRALAGRADWVALGAVLVR